VFSRLKISTIVNASALGLAGVIALSAGSAIIGVKEIGTNLDYVTTNSVPSVEALGAIETHIEVARVRAARVAMAEHPDAAQKDIKSLDEGIASVDKKIDDYKALVSDETEKGQYDAATAQWLVVRDNLTKIRDLAQGGNPGEARAVFTGQLVADAKVLRAKFDEELAYNQKLVDTQSTVASKAIKSTNRNAWVLGAVALLTALGVLVMFRFRVTSPLGNLRDAMNEMASGHLDISVPGVEKHDELGEIARALEGIKVSLAARAKTEAEARLSVQQQVTGALEEGLSALKEGRLDYQISRAFPAEYETLRSDFNSTLSALAQQMAEVARSSGAVRTGAGEISAAAQDLARRTEGQAASLGETSNTVRELTNSVTESRHSASAAAVAAQEAEREASTSGDLMREAVSAMNSISGTSEKMRSIVEIIDGISFQTNLLALNAGVEAARAGDAGKGFAVVATEVRNLAERSAGAAKEINALIVNSGNEVRHGVQMVSETQSSLQRIVAKASELAGMIGGIAEGATKQADAIEQVNHVISELDKATQQNAALVEESTAASRSLAHESERLSAVVEQFSLGRSGGGYGYAAPAAAPAVVELPPMRASRPVPKAAPVSVGNTAVAGEDWSEF
jgi:methyl-accepting chemotaxis protein